MRICGTIMILTMLSLCHVQASASGRGGDDGPRVRVRMGITLGGNYPIMTTYRDGCTANFTPKYGLAGSIDFDVRFGRMFSLATDLVFRYTRIDIADDKHHFYEKVPSFAIQLPIKAVLHVKRLSIFAGPVITMMDDPHYYVQGERTMFGRVYPTLTYTAGASMRLGGHFNLGLSYDGAFNTMTNYYAYNLNPADAREIRTQLSHVSVNLGFSF